MYKTKVNGFQYSSLETKSFNMIVLAKIPPHCAIALF